MGGGSHESWNLWGNICIAILHEKEVAPIFSDFCWSGVKVASAGSGSSGMQILLSTFVFYIHYIHFGNILYIDVTLASFLHFSLTYFLVVHFKQMLFMWEVCHNRYYFIFKSGYWNCLCYCCCCIVALVWAWLFVELVRNCCVTAKSLHLISSSPTQCRRCHWGAGWMIMNGYHRF